MLTVLNIMDENTSSHLENDRCTVCLVLDDEHLSSGAAFVDRLMRIHSAIAVTHDRSPPTEKILNESISRFHSWTDNSCLLLSGYEVDDSMYKTLEATANGVEEGLCLQWKPSNIWVFVGSILRLPNEASINWRIFRVCKQDENSLFLFEL